MVVYSLLLLPDFDPIFSHVTPYGETYGLRSWIVDNLHYLLHLRKFRCSGFPGVLLNQILRERGGRTGKLTSVQDLCAMTFQPNRMLAGARRWSEMQARLWNYQRSKERCWRSPLNSPKHNWEQVAMSKDQEGHRLFHLWRQDRKDAWTSASSKKAGPSWVVNLPGKFFFSCLHIQERCCPDVLSPLLSPSMTLVQICWDWQSCQRCQPGCLVCTVKNNL